MKSLWLQHPVWWSLSEMSRYQDIKIQRTSERTYSYKLDSSKVIVSNSNHVDIYLGHSNSLSKWSKYPNSIREKNQTPWTIRKILAIRFYVVKNTSMKIFLWSKKHKFLDLAMFSKNIENFWDIAKISQILFGYYFGTLFFQIRILYG